MSIFQFFSKLKIHKTHYIDGFSKLPENFFKFLFQVFEREDVIKSIIEVYQEILNVIVHKSKIGAVTYAHFSYIRQGVEFSKRVLSQDLEGEDCLEPLVPDIDHYETIFKFFAQKPKPMREELEMLCEWSKYSLNMSFSIPSIREKLKNLFLNYITEPEASINHYTELINDALEEERQNELNEMELNFCPKDPRTFKDIYLRKKTISNLCKPVSVNSFTSDPDDVCQMMIIILFQISLSNVVGFIENIKDSIKILREEIDDDEDEVLDDQQLSFSIPREQAKCDKKLKELRQKVEALIEVKKTSSGLSRVEQNRIEQEYSTNLELLRETKLKFENLTLQEKIINRRTLRIIQILCQLTIKDGITDDTVMWVASNVIEHIKFGDIENMDTCLAIIVDILLHDKDLSLSFLRMYESLLPKGDVPSDLLVDENPEATRVITIIKALLDIFCILDNYGIDYFENFFMRKNEKGELVENVEVDNNDRIHMKLSNKLLGILIKKFLFCQNIHVRYLITEGLMKICLENKVGNPNHEDFPLFSHRITGNQSLYWALIFSSIAINEQKMLTMEKSNPNCVVLNQMSDACEIFLRKYCVKKPENCLHMIEACLYIFSFVLNQSKNRTRRANKKDSRIKFQGLLTTINSDRILQYLYTVFNVPIREKDQEGNDIIEDNPTGPIFKILSPVSMCLVLLLDFYEDFFKNNKITEVFGVVHENFHTHKMGTKELLIVQAILKETRFSKLNQHSKEVVKQMKQRVDETLEAKNKNNSEDMEEQNPKEINIDKELDDVEKLCVQTAERFELFEAGTNITIKDLQKATAPPESVRKPRFTDMHMVTNREASTDFKDIDYKLADNEELYTKVYTEYVKRSIGSSNKHPNKKAKKKNKPNENLGVINEEDSDENSSVASKSSPSKRYSESSVKISSPEFNEYQIKEGPNEHMSKLRSKLFELSQNVCSKQKSELKTRNEESKSKPYAIKEEFEQSQSDESEEDEDESEEDEDKSDFNDQDSSSDVSEEFSPEKPRKRKI